MKGHILVIADGRSPTALSWIENVKSLGYKISLVSTYPCEPPEGLNQFHMLPIAFSRFSGRSATKKTPSSDRPMRSFIRRFSPTLQKLRYFLGPLTLVRQRANFQRIVNDIQPDLVHALRIPFEGMLGSYTPAEFPFLAATWGNDLTLHAKGSLLMKIFTRRCLKRADGLTSDTHRDVRLSRTWGLDADAPALVIPGSGGLDLEAIQQAGPFNTGQFGIMGHGNWVVNPRGFRYGSVRQDVFFAAIPKVLEERPDTSFICPGMAGKKQAHEWVRQFGIGTQTFLLPQLEQPQLWALFKRSQVFVSPSVHDGTPNALLEAMACGCLPVVGDIESLREWIQHNKNGLLVDPTDPDSLAEAIILALDRPAFHQQAAEINLTMIEERAAQSAARMKIDRFYSQFLG